MLNYNYDLNHYVNQKTERGVEVAQQLSFLKSQNFWT
jgi:hypothetical protein